MGSARKLRFVEDRLIQEEELASIAWGGGEGLSFVFVCGNAVLQVRTV
jgi:hypothetical protein